MVMNPYEFSLNNYRRFLSLTSLTPAEFLSLLEIFSRHWQHYQSHYDLKGERRQYKKYGEDARSSLAGNALKLFFLLGYLKSSSTQQQYGVMFQISQGKVSQWLKVLLPILEQVLAEQKHLPKRTGDELYAFLCAHAQGVLFMDATERAVPRATDQDVQQEHYSGKRHGHYVKNTIICNISRQVLYLGETEPGSVHDVTLAREAELELPVGSLILQDLGYQGFAPKGAMVLMPTKKPRGQKLPPHLKLRNQRIAKVRVIVEHSISGIKRLGIVSGKIRLRTTEIRDKVILIATGLHNLRVRSRKPTCNLS